MSFMVTKQAQCFSLIASLLWLAAGPVVDAQSLAELARKERERKKTGANAKALSNEEVEKPIVEGYPNVLARFAMPKGWDRPIPTKKIVIAPCPGTTLPPRPIEPEGLTCGIAVGIDGPSRDSRENAAETLIGLQSEFLAKAVRQVEPWRARQMGGMPATETVVDLKAKDGIRRMRLVVAIEPKSGLIYMAALLSLPERFADFSEALDTVLAQFEAIPKPPPVAVPQ